MINLLFNHLIAKNIGIKEKEREEVVEKNKKANKKDEKLPRKYFLHFNRKKSEIRKMNSLNDNY